MFGSVGVFPFLIKVILSQLEKIIAKSRSIISNPVRRYSSALTKSTIWFVQSNRRGPKNENRRNGASSAQNQSCSTCLRSRRQTNLSQLPTRSKQLLTGGGKNLRSLRNRAMIWSMCYSKTISWAVRELQLVTSPTFSIKIIRIRARGQIRNLKKFTRISKNLSRLWWFLSILTKHILRFRQICQRLVILRKIH